MSIRQLKHIVRVADVEYQHLSPEVMDWDPRIVTYFVSSRTLKDRLGNQLSNGSKMITPNIFGYTFLIAVARPDKSLDERTLLPYTLANIPIYVSETTKTSSVEFSDFDTVNHGNMHEDRGCYFVSKKYPETLKSY